MFAAFGVSAFAGMTGLRAVGRLCRNRGFSGLAGFSGFRFARLAVFAMTENPVDTNGDERLAIKDEIVES